MSGPNEERARLLTQTAMESLGSHAAAGDPAPRVQTALESLNEQFGNQIGELRDMVNRLTDTRSRLLGPVETPAGPDVEKSQPNSDIDHLWHTLEWLGDVANDLRVEVDALERL